MRNRLTGLYKGQRKVHHICYPDVAGQCPSSGEPAVHLTNFHWYPPGDFDEEWLTKAGRKAVREGLEAAQHVGEAEKDAARHSRRGKPSDLSPVEERLKRLRKDADRHVSFPGLEEGLPSTRQDGSQLDAPRAGILRKPGVASSARAIVPYPKEVKEEVINLDSDAEEVKVVKKAKKRRATGVGETLQKP